MILVIISLIMGGIAIGVSIAHLAKKNYLWSIFCFLLAIKMILMGIHKLGLI